MESACDLRNLADSRFAPSLSIPRSCPDWNRGPDPHIIPAASQGQGVGCNDDAAELAVELPNSPHSVPPPCQGAT